MAAEKIGVIALVALLVLLTLSAAAALKNFQVEETDFVKLSPEAIDEDDDNITYGYTYPLDDQGEWQTGYDDAGEYTIDITASDGKAQTTETVLLVVKNKNQAPVIGTEKISIKETQGIDLKTVISDADGDTLRYAFSPPFDDNGQWESTYDDAGIFTTQITVRDDEFTVTDEITIEIFETNQAPEITDIFSESAVVSATEGESSRFSVRVEDGDGDAIEIYWLLDQEEIATGSVATHFFDYFSAGEHSLALQISDGKMNISREWTLIVANTNRKPELSFSPVTVREGETVALELPKFDLDNDPLTYTFTELFANDGKWHTTFEDAGEYEITILASDGSLESEAVVAVTVLDVDRAPQIHLPQQAEAWEAEEFSLYINTEDPDGDEVEINLINAPQGVKFDQETKMMTWSPDYDTIRRSGGFFSTILSHLRLEHYLLSKKRVQVTVVSCGKELCTTDSFTLVVHNVNRAPELGDMDAFSFSGAEVIVPEVDESVNASNETATTISSSSTPQFVVSETELAQLEVVATDPDGDIVWYDYSEPLDSTGSWETGYEDAGVYTVYVTATDGRLEDNVSLPLTVLNTNRGPSLSVSTDEVLVNEQEEFTLQLDGSDPDGDNLSIQLDFLPAGAEFSDGVFVWTPDNNIVKNKTDRWYSSFISNFAYLNKRYNPDEKIFWLEFVVTDGEVDVVHPVKVIIKDVNQAPEIVESSPDSLITATIGVPVRFKVVAIDGDEDDLEYTWNIGFGDKDVSGTNVIERVFTSSGEKTVSVLVSDGIDKVEQTWEIFVPPQEVLAPVEEPVQQQPFTVGVYVINH
jgi:PKD repeat protein